MRFRLITSWIIVLLVSLLVFGGIGLYSVINLIPKYETKIEAILSEKLQAKVSFKIQKIQWRGIEPQLKVTNFTVNSAKDHYKLSLDDIVVKLDLLKSLMSWTPAAKTVLINTLGIEVNIDDLTNENDLQVSSLNTHGNESTINALNQIIPNISEILHLLANQNDIEFNQAHLDIIKDDEKFEIPFDITWKQVGYQLYQLSARAKLKNYQNNNIYLNSNIDFSSFSGLKANGTLTVQLSEIGSYVNKIFDIPYELQGGKALFETQFVFDEKLLRRLNGRVSFKNVDIQHTTSDKVLRPMFASTFAFTEYDNHIWEFAIKNLETSLSDRQFSLSSLELIGDSQTDHHNKAKLYIDEVNIESIDDLYRTLVDFFHISSESLAKLNQLDIAGSLKNTIAVLTYDDSGLLNWQIKTSLDDFDINDQLSKQSVNRLNANIYVDDHHGWVRILSNDLFFSDPGVFPLGLPNLAINSFVDWDIDDDSIKVSLHKIGINLPYLQVETSGVITVPFKDTDKTNVSVFGYINGEDVGKRFKNFLPTAGIDPDLYEWLTKNITSVPSANATFVIDGPIMKMPFVKNEGNFVILLNMAESKFYPFFHWPLISNINARLWIENETIKIYGTQGNSEGATVHHASFTVPNIAPGVPSFMFINGDLSAYANQSFRYLSNSPLQQELSLLMENLNYYGDIGLKLAMKFPLGNPSAENVISGEVSLDSGTVHLRPVDVELYNVKGKLSFKNDYYHTEGITAWFNPNAPITFTLDSTKQYDSDNQYTYTGDISSVVPLDDIDSRLPRKVASLVSGYAPLSASFNVDPDTGGKVDFSMMTSYIESKLPPPFNFARDNPYTMYGFVGWDAGVKLVNARVHVNDGVNLSATVDLRDKKHIPVVADVALPAISSQQWTEAFALSQDTVKPILYKKKRLYNSNLYVFLPSENEFSDLWFCPLSYANLGCLFANAIGPVQPYLNIQIPAIDINGFELSQVTLDTSATNNEVEAILNTANRKLTAYLPVNYFVPWRVHLDNFSYDPDVKDVKSDELVAADESTSTAEKSKDETLEQKDLVASKVLKDFDARGLAIIPALDVSVNDLNVDGRNIHSSLISTKPIKNGISIESFMIRDVGPSVLTGNAMVRDNPVKIHVKLNADSKNWGKLLTYYGYPDYLEGGNGPIAAEFHWEDSYIPEFENLSGQMKLDVRDGVINKVKPGFSKLIGIFSINTYFERLMTSYSDFTTSGMMFNSITGEYSMIDGKAETTPNVEIATPSFDALVTGNVDFKNNTIDQKVKVQPHLNGIFAIAAGILGGPIVGVATFFAEELITNTLLKDQGLITVNITGPLNDPEIKKSAL